MKPTRHSRTHRSTQFTQLFTKILFTAVAIGLVTACSMKEPILPTWALPVNVPLASEVFQIGDELVNDSTITAEGPDSLINISFDGDLDEIDLSLDEFSVETIDTTHSYQLGELNMDSLEALNTGHVPLGDIFPELQKYVLDGQTINFNMPDTTLTPDRELLETDEFEAALATDGQIQLDFANNLPFALGPNASQPAGIQIEIFDNVGTHISTITIEEEIGPGEVVQQSAPLVEEATWIYTPLEVQYILPVADESTFPLDAEVLDTAGVNIMVDLLDIRADEAIARLEPQETQDQLAFALDSEHRLREALVQSGGINISLHNTTPLDALISLTFKNMFDQQGVALNRDVAIPAQSNEQLWLELSDVEIAHAEFSGEFVDSIQIEYSTATVETNDMVHIRSTDGVSVNIVSDNITFASFSGSIESDTLSIDPFEEENLVDYSGIPNDIELEDVSFGLTLSSELDIENLFLNLTITGYHHDDGRVADSAQISVVNAQMNPGSIGNPGVTVISLDGPEVADFLNILPDAIKTSGNVQISGDVNISDNSSVNGTYSFATPMRFSITNAAIIQGDEQILTDEDIDEDVRTTTDDNLEEATLSLGLTNFTPLSGSVRVIVSADPQRQDIYDSTYFNPELEFVKEVVVPAATIDPQTGFVSSADLSELELSLTREEFRLFNDPPLKIGYEFRIDATDGVVALRSTDYVKVSGLARIVVIVRDE